MTDTSSADSRIKVLVVEDELIIAKGIEKSLMAMGYAVTGSVASGEEALAKVHESSPDLIIMDIHLQGDMDGVETAEKIRSLADIPVIYLTAYADPDSLGRAKLTEPFGYIVKPFQEHTLRSAIEMGLYKHRMERRVKDSEQWLATILRSIGDAIIATDAQGLITFMNPVAEALTGWAQNDALGKELLEVFRVREETQTAAAGNIVQKVIHNGAPVTLLGRNYLLARDGREIPIEAKATPFLGVEGKNMGLALIFLDISELIKTEEALRRSERLLSIKNQVANIFLTVPDEEMYAEVMEVIMAFMESPLVFSAISTMRAILSCLP